MLVFSSFNDTLNRTNLKYEVFVLNNTGSVNELYSFIDLSFPNITGIRCYFILFFKTCSRKQVLIMAFLSTRAK
jgi:hypothetical protein